ncbi:hypothetical protein GGR50DRAFT_654869 [Xylaria sp. CBS 124048]|nr:hypothetical protein GGR50DRAFT_654869 [Xylaria sp. CBS 124048]
MRFIKLIAVAIFATLGMASFLAIDAGYGTCNPVTTVTAYHTVDLPVTSMVTVTVTAGTATYGDSAQTPTVYGGGGYGVSSSVATGSDLLSTTLITETSTTPMPPYGEVTFTEPTSSITASTGVESSTGSVFETASTVSYGPKTVTGTSIVTGVVTGTGTTTGVVTGTSTTTGVVTGTITGSLSVTGSVHTTTGSVSYTHSFTTSKTTTPSIQPTTTMTAKAAMATGAVSIGALFGGAAFIIMLQLI